MLPGLLDSNPFSENGQLRIPAGVSNILDVLKEALQLLNTFNVHSDISSQLLAYLFFFTNASLFNILMERGECCPMHNILYVDTCCIKHPYFSCERVTSVRTNTNYSSEKWSSVNFVLFKGSGGGFYQWSRGVQIRANLDLVIDWTQSVGLGDLAAEFFQKLSSAVNLLATPKENLLQVRLYVLRIDFFFHLNNCTCSWITNPWILNLFGGSFQ